MWAIDDDDVGRGKPAEPGDSAILQRRYAETLRRLRRGGAADAGREFLELRRLQDALRTARTQPRLPHPRNWRRTTIAVAASLTLVLVVTLLPSAPGIPPVRSDDWTSDDGWAPPRLPYNIAPRLRDDAALLRAQLDRALTAGGDVAVWVLVGSDGAVQQARIRTSSGNTDVDDAALTLARAQTWTPAQLRRTSTDAWITHTTRLGPLRR